MCLFLAKKVCMTLTSLCLSFHQVYLPLLKTLLLYIILVKFAEFDIHFYSHKLLYQSHSWWKTRYVGKYSSLMTEMKQKYPCFISNILIFIKKIELSEIIQFFSAGSICRTGTNELRNNLKNYYLNYFHLSKNALRTHESLRWTKYLFYVVPLKKN